MTVIWIIEVFCIDKAHVCAIIDLCFIMMFRIQISLFLINKTFREAALGLNLTQWNGLQLKQPRQYLTICRYLCYFIFYVNILQLYFMCVFKSYLPSITVISELFFMILLLQLISFCFIRQSSSSQHPVTNVKYINHTNTKRNMGNPRTHCSQASAI